MPPSRNDHRTEPTDAAPQHDWRAEKAALEAELMCLRGQLIARDTALAFAREDLERLQASVPSLQARAQLNRRIGEQQDRIAELQRARIHWQQLAERESERAQRLAEELARAQSQRHTPYPAEHVVDFNTARLWRDKSVLCVGGGAPHVQVFHHLAELTGARLMHHDGDDSDYRLEAGLAEADLVICQTGCISHDAYWRVQDHCKRTGKRCVLVDAEIAGTPRSGAEKIVHCLRTLPAMERERREHPHAVVPILQLDGSNAV